MIDVNISINAPVLYCDESILGVQFGNGYSFAKEYIDDLPFKEKITDGRGQLTISYLGSVKSDEHGKYLMCLKKDGTYQIENPLKGCGVYTDEDMLCDAQAEAQDQLEADFLHKMFSLLHLFKDGNIGTKEIFLDHIYSLGIIDSKLNHTRNSVTRNITDTRLFSLSPDEVLLCNQFLTDYQGAEYTLLKESVDEFVWGLEQCDEATGFEQFTTALEMTLLGHGQQGKKEALSKRVAVMLGSSQTDMTCIYSEMKNYYRYRSESLHEGNGQNITQSELYGMENIVRCVLKECLSICKNECSANSAVTWDAIKRTMINQLKQKVTAKNAAGTFPA